MKTFVTVGSKCVRKLFWDFSSLKFIRIKTMDFSIRNSAGSDSSCEHNFRIKRIQSFIPKLTSDLHKGECGRVGVIGGSFEYTGAPYFAAISSLKLGADLVHVFCCGEAGPIIKSYSPELIVHPFLDNDDVVRKIEPWLEKLHVLVIGPGLGRDEGIFKNVSDIIKSCKKKTSKNLPLVIDADGLQLIIENTDLLKDYKGPIILTPNVVEFKRLSSKISEKNPLKLSAALNAVILQKGLVDIITNGMYNNIFKLKSEEVTIACDVPGSNRRCGGQGDVLSGCIATFIAWLELYFNQDNDNKLDYNELEKKNRDWFFDTLINYSYAVYGACMVTRTCSRLAYEANQRGMTASDMITCINKAFQMHFGY